MSIDYNFVDKKEALAMKIATIKELEAELQESIE